MVTRSNGRGRGVGLPVRERGRFGVLRMLHEPCLVGLAERRIEIFTTEYSMRTGMEAVYTLCEVDRGVPEVWNSEYDVRDMLNAAVKLRDGEPLTTFGRNGLEHKAIETA